jgi:hypothetical protein
MKRSLKAGIVFGTFMSAWFIFSSVVIDKQDIVPGILTGLVLGLLSAVFFGATMHWFTKKTDKVVQINLLPGERLLFQTRANHFKGMEAVGGKLTLTDQRLVFKSHYLNIQAHLFSIPLQNIENAQRYKSIGIINNGLKLIVNGEEERFVVDKADEWVSRLAGTISTPA